MKVAKAERVRPDIPIYTLPLSLLEPISKIQSAEKYELIKDNIRTHNLYHPLVVRVITHTEWEDEAARDNYITAPLDQSHVHYRIQCGCQRWVALKELEYTHVQCYFLEEKEQAEQLCKLLRQDKRWKRNYSGL